MSASAARLPTLPADGGAVRREWVIASDVQAIAPIVQALQLLCEAAGFSARHCRFNVPVSVTEALSNAILRGNGADIARPVHLGVVVDATRLVVEVTDEGTGFDVGAIADPCGSPERLDREDGRGVFLMRSLMTEIVSEPAVGRRGHTLRLILFRS